MRSLHESDALWRYALLEEEPHARREAASRANLATGPGAAISGIDAPIEPLGHPTAQPAMRAKLMAARAAVASALPAQAPGVPPPASLLSPDETKACLSLGLAPSQYVACKRLLILAAAAASPGPLSAQAAIAAVRGRVDERRGRQLWEHLKKRGWLGA